MDFFLDPTIDGILCVRGGTGSLPILPLLDHDAIAAHPKWIVGLSDPSALLLGLFARSGLVSISGQMVVQLHEGMQEYTETHWKGMLRGDWPEYLGNNPRWSPPWVVPAPPTDAGANQASPSETDRQALPGAWMDPATGLRALTTLVPGSAQGPLLPANFSMMTRLIGTPYLPSLDGAILLLEEIDERPEGLDRMVAHLALSGLDRKLAGLVLGQFSGCTPRNEKMTERDGLEEVWTWARSLGIPVLAGFPYGHERLATAVPVGATVQIEQDPPGLRLLETPPQMGETV